MALPLKPTEMGFVEGGGGDLGRRSGSIPASSWCTVHGTDPMKITGKRLRRIISCTSNLYM